MHILIMLWKNTKILIRLLFELLKRSNDSALFKFEIEIRVILGWPANMSLFIDWIKIEKNKLMVHQYCDSWFQIRLYYLFISWTICINFDNTLHGNSKWERHWNVFIGFSAGNNSAKVKENRARVDVKERASGRPDLFLADGQVAPVSL